jgi:uncharacterized protein YjbK
MEDVMDTKHKFQFKTLLSLEEYIKLLKRFSGYTTDTQTNHYFDTPRFSLKALDASLRVRERENLELTFKRKKGYTMQDITLPIDREFFEKLKATGVIPEENEIKLQLAPLIGKQKLHNYISLSTTRIYLSYKSGLVLIDKSEYLNEIDYELSFLVSNYNEGKKEFIQLINELGITYTKSEKKIKRALKAYKKYISS